MKKIMALVVCFLIAFSITACGSSGDDLEGKWKGSNQDYGEVTWEFDGKGKVIFTDLFGEKVGKYKIEDDGKLTVSLWSADNPYTYKISGGKLTLTSTDKLAPSFKDMKEQ